MEKEFYVDDLDYFYNKFSTALAKSKSAGGRYTLEKSYKQFRMILDIYKVVWHLEDD